MAFDSKAKRLGDILLEKGLLREDQLQLAIAEQKRRRAQIDPANKHQMEASSIGEILVEMGYITRQQLKRGLNWQMYLRKMTLVMSLVAPMMSAAGGAIAQTTTSTQTTNSSASPPPASLMIQAEDFSAMQGIKVEPTTDVGGGMNIGAIDAGDWVAYANQELNLVSAASYNVTYRVSSLYGGGAFELYDLITGVQYGRVDVPSTGGFQKWIELTQVLHLPAGRHTLGIKALAKGFNINWLRLDLIAPVSVSSVALSSASAIISSSASSAAPTSATASSTLSSSAQSSIAPSSSAVSSQAVSGTSPTLSLRIEAEAYSGMGGIKVEPTKDEGGGSNIGAIDASDWLAYGNHPIYSTAAGNYKISYRVSSLYGGGSFYLYHLDTGQKFAPIEVPRTGNFQKWVSIEQTITLPAGTHRLGITALTKGFNLNWIQVDYKGIALPVTIQAEDYAAMKGIKVEATTDLGGGSNIGAIDAGDWLSYENKVIDIPATGNYKVTYRTSSLYGGGSFNFHEADGSRLYDVVQVPKTGGFQKWVNVERVITLEAGAHIFGMTALSKGFNINWFKIEPAPAGALPSNGLQSSGATSSAATSSAAQVSSSPVVSSSSSAGALSSKASSSAATVVIPEASVVAGPVYLRWNIPNLREDGSVLDITELGGYEVRYRPLGATEYTYINIEDPYKNEVNIAWLEGSYQFEVAAFDRNGLYSRFIKLAPH